MVLRALTGDKGGDPPRQPYYKGFDPSVIQASYRATRYRHEPCPRAACIRNSPDSKH
jgi:hypothetical protein